MGGKQHYGGGKRLVPTPEPNRTIDEATTTRAGKVHGSTSVNVHARMGSPDLLASFGSHYNYSVVGIVIILTINYGVKQSQFIKSTSDPHASDSEKSNEIFYRAIRGCYYSITVSNHRLITVIRFVVKSYTHP